MRSFIYPKAKSNTNQESQEKALQEHLSRPNSASRSRIALSSSLLTQIASSIACWKGIAKIYNSYYRSLGQKSMVRPSFVQFFETCFHTKNDQMSI